MKKRNVLLALVGLCLAVGIAGVVAVTEGLAPSLLAGEQAPDFSLSVHGSDSTMSLASLRGKVVYVHFWATWCAPCKAEAPALERLYQRHRGDGFEILALSQDVAGSSEAIEKFRSEVAVTFPILLDPERSVSKSYLTLPLPETFLVGRDGKVIDHYTGGQDWDEPAFSEAIQAALRATIAP